MRRERDDIHTRLNEQIEEPPAGMFLREFLGIFLELRKTQNCIYKNKVKFGAIRTN